MYNPYSERSVLGKLFDQPAKRNVPHIHNEHNEIDQHINFIANWYRISIDDVELLGEGGFGKVFKVNSRNLAVKVMKKGRLAEKELRRNFNHENLLKHYQHYSSDTHYYLESECLECNLWEVRTKQNSIPKDSEIWRLTYQVACGLAEMHHNKVIHRDIKLQNILLRSGSSFRVVLGDYGLAKCQETCDFVSTSGTPGFVDPSLEKGGNSFDYSYDIYSFGKTLIQFILGNRFNYQYSDEMLENYIKNIVSSKISNLIHKMIDRNRNQRIKLKEILSMSKKHAAPKPQKFNAKPTSNHLFSNKVNKQSSSKEPIGNSDRGIVKKGLGMFPVLMHVKNLSQQITERLKNDPNNSFLNSLFK